MKIYIGHDSRFPQATRVCRKSIEDHSKKRRTRNKIS